MAYLRSNQKPLWRGGLDADRETYYKGVYHHCTGQVDDDHLLVIREGEIVEKGNHQQLLDRGGFYHHLYPSQFKGREI